MKEIDKQQHKTLLELIARDAQIFSVTTATEHEIYLVYKGLSRMCAYGMQKLWEKGYREPVPTPKQEEVDPR